MMEAKKYLYSYEAKKIESASELDAFVKSYKAKYDSDSRKMLALVNTLKPASCAAEAYYREKVLYKYLRAWCKGTIWVNS